METSKFAEVHKGERKMISKIIVIIYSFLGLWKLIELMWKGINKLNSHKQDSTKEKIR